MNTLLYAKLLVSISVNAIKIKWATNQIRSKVGSMIEFAAFFYISYKMIKLNLDT